MFAAASDHVKFGFKTSDGWSVTFERAIASLGSIDFDLDTCIEYGEAHYRRVIDYAVADRERLAIIHGLGECGVEFRIDSPSDDSLLGAGVSEADLALMRTEASDPYAEDARVSLWVRGRATKAGVTKSFDWKFRHGYELNHCQNPGGGRFVSEVDLQSGQTLAWTIEVRVEEVFRVATDDRAPIELDALAAADADDDGKITFEELAVAPAPVSEFPSAPPEPDHDDEPVELDGTYGSLIYEALFPRVVRLMGGGPCAAELRDRR